MDERDIAVIAVLLPALIIIGGVVVMVAGIRHATRQAEFQHQERLAMIERGMHAARGRAAGGAACGAPTASRCRSASCLCGLGLGLVMLITFAAGAPATGAGIGGAIVMVGHRLHRQRVLHRAAGTVSGAADTGATARDGRRADRTVPSAGLAGGAAAPRSLLATAEGPQLVSHPAAHEAAVQGAAAG